MNYFGNEMSNFKHGLTLIPCFCIDCGKRIVSCRATKCRSCSHKGQQPKYKFPKGHIPWNKGKNFSEEAKLKMSKAHRKLKRWVGEKNPNWLNGLSWITKSHYNGKEYKDWRKVVFKRDNYVCQKCNTENGQGAAVYLTAHHIKSWVSFPELRYNIDNGLTLCETCHAITDNYKGRAKRK